MLTVFYFSYTGRPSRRVSPSPTHRHNSNSNGNRRRFRFGIQQLRSKANRLKRNGNSQTLRAEKSFIFPSVTCDSHGLNLITPDCRSISVRGRHVWSFHRCLAPVESVRLTESQYFWPTRIDPETKLSLRKKIVIKSL